MLQNFSSLQTRVRPLMMPFMDKDRKSMYHLDADTLDCPFCVEALTPPVYQVQETLSSAVTFRDCQILEEKTSIIRITPFRNNFV